MNQKTETDAIAFQTMPKPSRLPQRPRPRQPSKFEVWAWSPVISFQIGLTLSYLAMIYFGTTAFVAQVPAFRETAPDGWSIYWAIAVVIGGLLASIGSVARTKLFEVMELIGSLLLTLTVGSYAAVVLFIAHVGGDIDRHTAGAGFVVLTVPVLVRMLWLASQSLRR